jgi:peptidoglycan/xylan/chitin deacetylase (PgdA/CDA1 family)
MNLVAFSIRTKGLHNFARRLWTVFARFGLSERRIRKALYALLTSLKAYQTAPTFFIPAVILRRHPTLITEIARNGAEIGIHGYVHNDYRHLNRDEQYQQTQQAMTVFETLQLPYYGFRNPYLGWTEDSLHVFDELGFTYESNEAIIHNVIDIHSLPALLRQGYEKSLMLFQAIAPSAYALRPHFEGKLLRIPTCIPDDEMLFDRLRITDPAKIGHIWSQIMQRVYDYGGLFALNLHPERGILCKPALDILLDYAHSRPERVWLARLDDIARWWKERYAFRLSITALGESNWLVEANCTSRATLHARHLTINYQLPIASPGAAGQDLICGHRCIVHATKYPGIGLSPQTPQEVMDFLHEQGYPVVNAPQEDAENYSLYLDRPAWLGNTREEQREKRSALVQQIEQLDEPLLYFGCWPDNCRAALSISGDIDSVTIQDFFLRMLNFADISVDYIFLKSFCA